MSEQPTMHPNHLLTVEANPHPADCHVISQGIDEYNRQHAGDPDHQELAVFVRDAERKILGGLLGDTYYGWLTISLLWIDAAWRGQGYGRALLHAAEAEALRLGCTHAHLDTLSF